MTVECPTCSGTGCRYGSWDGNDCLPCAGTGWVVRDCSCNACHPETAERLTFDTWTGEFREDLCPCATERPATAAEALAAHAKAMGWTMKEAA